MTKACGICAGFICIRANRNAERAIEPHTGRDEFCSNDFNIAPRKTISSLRGAKRPMLRYPQRFCSIMSNSCSTQLGRSGICSCIQAEGMIAPKEATTLQHNTPQERVRNQRGDTSAHRVSRNTAIVIMLVTVVTVINCAVVMSEIPVMSFHTCSTMPPQTIWIPIKIKR